MAYVLITVKLRHDKFVVFSARRGCVMELEVPGFDEAILENRIRAKLLRGTGSDAGLLPEQRERGVLSGNRFGEP